VHSPLVGGELGGVQAGGSGGALSGAHIISEAPGDAAKRRFRVLTG
jgi:hypothetical protein